MSTQDTRPMDPQTGELDESELDAASGGVITTGSGNRGSHPAGTSYLVPLASGGSGGGTGGDASQGTSLTDLAKVPSPMGPLPIPYPNL